MKWQELLNRGDGELLKKIICIDGKTMRGNCQNGESPSHVLSAWSKEDGFCLGQKAVEEKSNEITAVPELLDKLQIKGQIETREYYQTQDIKWMSQKKEWAGLKSIGMERKTIKKDEKTQTETRYYISSLETDIETMSSAVRGHWHIESMHWHLDVTFKEDANQTIDKVAAQNHNIIRKWCLSILKLTELTTRMKRLSMKKKRFVISLRPLQYLEEVLRQ